MENTNTQPEFKETRHMPQLEKVVKPFAFLWDGETLKMMILALLVVGGILGMVQVFSTPSEAREIQSRIYEIEDTLRKKESALTTVQTEWAQLDIVHQDLLRKVEGVADQKRELENGGGMIRMDMEALRSEKEDLTRQLGAVRQGLALGM